tara:strand:- start:3908 stop:4978 length:1071 start_codon:yes stop_codon:yes gene_type:complete
MTINNKLIAIKERYDQINTKLSGENSLKSEELINLNKEFAELSPIVEKIYRYDKLNKESNDVQSLIDNETDNEIKIEAQKEQINLKKEIPIIWSEILKLLLPKDTNDEKNVILEIRAGTGGDEASLFGADLMKMYQKYAESKKWKFETMSLSETGLKGIKEFIGSISGRGVYAKLKFESGVHRVQRVPLTESSGRVHTSAATVAVLPEAEEVDIKIEEKDLRIDIFRSSGPGGQSVNTTDSAVRITHLPTGVVVSQQDEKSQHKNKAKALKILRARLFDREINLQAEKRAKDRKSQVGSGDRSERIRTYNFPQGRVSDHRINITLHNLDEIMMGNLDDIINPLLNEDETKRLSMID